MSKAGVVIAFSGPDNHKVTFAFKFVFHASNNIAKYEAMIYGLKIAKDLEIRRLKVISDLQLIVNQIKK